MDCFFLQRYKYVNISKIIQPFILENLSFCFYTLQIIPPSRQHRTDYMYIAWQNQFQTVSVVILVWFHIFTFWEAMIEDWDKFNKTDETRFLFYFHSLSACWIIIYVSQATTNRLFFLRKSIWFLKDNHQIYFHH